MLQGLREGAPRGAARPGARGGRPARPPARGGPPPAPEAPPAAPPPEEKKIQTNTSRCWTCNKKIGLTGFQCKCEYYFCSEHRYNDKHNCQFDFKQAAKTKLAADNPTIQFAKMEKM